MRAWALAGAMAFGLAALTGAASAKTWTDPAGRITFETPNVWTQDNRNQPDMTYLVVGTANNECQIVAVPRAQTAANTARDVRRAGQSQISAESWITVANAMPDIFAPDRNSPSAARLISQSLDTSRFWPVQRAELGGPSHPLVHGAIEIRPGLEIWAFCLTYEGADPVAVYDSVINSIGTPRDAELQAQAEQQDADRSAAQAAADAEAAAAAAQQQQQQHPRRDRHPTTSGTPQSGAMPPPM